MKKCARCEKTVYPTEELKCLDKVWHKFCFKCKVCGMTLNMRNYKGFDKEPYCDAHIPKAKATTVAITPELKRIAENTKLQSNIKYHEDFERSKGKFIQVAVADDPEMQRIKQNTKIISNVAYHGELERKADMESRRTLNENGYQAQAADQANANVTTTTHSTHSTHLLANTMSASHYTQNTSNTRKAVEEYEQPNSTNYASAANSKTVIYTSEQGAVNNAPQRRIGSVHDIDPVNHNYGSLGRIYKAMYDYVAQDDDEVGFIEGDLIINVSNIDGGWMTGEVQRTGQTGMLPANYVQLANI